MTNFLLVATEIPEDPLNGGDHRIWNLLGRGKADLLCLSKKKHAGNGELLTKKYEWQNIELVSLSKSIRPISYQNFFVRSFITQNREQIKIIDQYLKKYLHHHENTIVIALGHEMAMVLSFCLPYRFIFDPTDSKSLYFERRFKHLGFDELSKKFNSKYLSLLYRRVENYITRCSQLSIVPSKIDQQWILRGNSQAEVLVIGNGTSWLEKPPIERVKKSSSMNYFTIAFHGGMTWAPNRISALYLIEDIFPLIQSQLPSVKLRIAGSPVYDELARYSDSSGVEICGFVENIRDWLAECDVYVMPMLQGSGVKNKLIEAMAAGLTIVTNSMGAEALPEEAKQGVIIANGEDNIAKAVVHLLNNPQESLELGRKAREMAEKYFHWEIYSQQLATRIEQLSLKNV